MQNAQQGGNGTPKVCKALARYNTPGSSASQYLIRTMCPTGARHDNNRRHHFGDESKKGKVQDHLNEKHS
jgi:hypothetical protein